MRAPDICHTPDVYGTGHQLSKLSSALGLDLLGGVVPVIRVFDGLVVISLLSDVGAMQLSSRPEYLSVL